MIYTRRMTLGDLDTVLDWAAAEGWNPGMDDAAAFLAADPQGFFVAVEDDMPIAAISVVNHSKDFAFLGLYLCRPSHRGRGIGYSLWQHALEHAGERTVGLDGVPDQQTNYARSGFVHAGSTTRYSGDVAASPHDAVRQTEKADIPRLVALEAAASGWEKQGYLSAWFAAAETRRTYVLEREGEISGLITARACRSDAKLGPLIATSADDALGLIRHAAVEFGETLILDVPASSAPLDALCQSLGLSPGFSTARMYRGQAKGVSAPFYAVASLELG